MTEIFEHNPADHEDPAPGLTWTIGAAGTILFAISVLLVAAAFYAAQSMELEAKVLDQPSIAVEAINAEQLDRLHDPRAPVRIELRTEGEESIVIPIDRAMDLIVQEMGPS